jgi:hypothetical protein
VFHELVWQGTSTKLRQRLGLVSWLCWWLKQTASIPFSGKSNFEFTQDGRITFVFMPTPAHEQSLGPIADNVAPKDKILLGSSSDHGHLSQSLVPDSAPNLPSAFKVIKRIFSILRVSDKAALAVWGRKLSLLEKGRIAERSYICLNAVEWVQSSLPSACSLFVTYELPPLNKALVYCNRMSGGRSIHVMHGHRLGIYQHSQATDIVLLSKIDEPWFRKRVDSSVRIWTVGHPRLENTRTRVGSPPAHDSTRLPRIAFFSQAFDSEYPSELRAKDWRILAGLRGKAEIRIRAHPSETVADVLKLMREAELDFAEISERGLVEDIKWCDAAASSWSTASMDAAVCERGIFWTCSNPEPYVPSQELRDHGIGVLLRNAEDWAPYLTQWFSSGWESPVTAKETLLRNLGMIGDTEKSWIERLRIDGGQARLLLDQHEE